MRMKYPDAIYPAEMARDLTEDEAVAYWATVIVRGDEDQKLSVIEEGAGIPPTPNKSARVYSRTRSGMTEWVTVEAGADFFDAVHTWLRAYNATQQARLDAWDQANPDDGENYVDFTREVLPRETWQERG